MATEVASEMAIESGGQRASRPAKSAALPYLLIALLVFTVVQLLCFGPILTHVGFYLDDWATLSYLHFAPKGSGLLGLLQHYLINDGRVLIRPVEVLHYGTIYYLCGDKPLLYHLVNLAFEVGCSLFSYCLLERLTGKRSLAFFGGLFLLLYPSHDATHYWVIASSVQLSLLLYLASLQLFLKATDLHLTGEKTKSYLYQGGGFLLFLAMLLNFESKTPLAATTVLICLAAAWRQTGSWKKGLAPAAASAGLLILGIAGYWIFLKVIVPMLGHGYAHAIKFSLSTLCSTLVTGLALNTPFQALPFFFSEAAAALPVITSSEIIRLVILLVVALLPLLFLTRAENKAVPREASIGSESEAPKAVMPATSTTALALLGPLDLLLIGAATVFFSYTIFGLSPDYMPTYLTVVNRINTGASFGVMLAVVALLQLSGQSGGGRPVLYKCLLTAGTAFCVILFTLANWGMSKPWIVSWTTQKQVRDAVAQLAGKIDPEASLLLVSCPRYVMWSPVFDGVWDFQNMARITLDRPDFNANVVSERLAIIGSGLRDVSYGYECGNYPFDKLFLMVAPHPQLIPARTPEVFIDTVARKGLSFGLDKKTLSKWREEAARLPKLEASH